MTKCLLGRCVAVSVSGEGFFEPDQQKRLSRTKQERNKNSNALPLFYEVAEDYATKRAAFREAHLEKAWKASEVNSCWVVRSRTRLKARPCSSREILPR